MSLVPHEYSGEEITFMEIAKDKSWILTSELYRDKETYFVQNIIKKVDLNTGEILFKIKNDSIYPHELKSIEFYHPGRYFKVSPDQKKFYAVTAGKNNRSLNLLILDIETGKTTESQLFNNVGKWLTQLYVIKFSFSPNGKFLVATYDDLNSIEQLAIVDMNSDEIKLKKEKELDTFDGWNFFFSSNSKKLAVTKGELKKGAPIEVYDTNTFSKKEITVPLTESVRLISLSDDGNSLAVIKNAFSTSVEIYDLKSMTNVFTFNKSKIPVPDKYSYNLKNVIFLNNSKKLFGSLERCIAPADCRSVVQIIWTYDIASDQLKSTQTSDITSQSLELNLSPDKEFVAVKIEALGGKNQGYKVYETNELRQVY